MLDEVTTEIEKDGIFSVVMNSVGGKGEILWELKGAKELRTKVRKRFNACYEVKNKPVVLQRRIDRSDHGVVLFVVDKSGYGGSTWSVSGHSVAVLDRCHDTSLF